MFLPETQISFDEVPGLVGTGVAGHKGQLTLGQWNDRRAPLFEGRLHFYEGHLWETVVRPMHLAKELGVRQVLLTNAAGGIHDALCPGSFLLLRDHLEWTRTWPWRQPGPGGWRGRPSPYSPRLLQLLVQAGQKLSWPLMSGIFAQVTGPCYETPAEIRGSQNRALDAVGMSTAREAQPVSTRGWSAPQCRASPTAPRDLAHFNPS